MRFASLALLLLTLAACGDSTVHHPIDGGVDASDMSVPPTDAATDLASTDLGAGVDGSAPSDLGAGPMDLGGPTDLGPPDLGHADLGSDLEIHLEGATLWTCNCHHGCGPGLDGSFSLVVTNTGTATRSIQVVDVTLTPIGADVGPFVATRDGHFTVMGTGVDHTFTVAGGAVQYSTVTPTVDLPRRVPGNYRIDVALRVDGTADVVSLDGVLVTTMATSGCP